MRSNGYEMIASIEAIGVLSNQDCPPTYRSERAFENRHSFAGAFEPLNDEQT